MSVTIIYKDLSEYGRGVEAFLHDFERRTAKKISILDPDTRQGAEFCRLYEVVEYPTIVATTNDGQMLSSWRGIPLPTIDEVSFYVQ